MLAPFFPTPWASTVLLNQIVVPALIGVLLKATLMVLFCTQGEPPTLYVHWPLVGSQVWNAPHVTVPVVWHWPVAGLHASDVHALLSLQVTAGPLTHWPAVQTSLTVHPFPSLHVVASGFAGLEQAPGDGLHVPASWH